MGRLTDLAIYSVFVSCLRSCRNSSVNGGEMAMEGTMSKIAALLLMIPLAIAQSPIQLQPNITICNWNGLRTGIIRDTIYLDGGSLWWQSASDSNGLPSLTNDGGIGGRMFSLNLSYAFDTTIFNETTSRLQPISKTGGTAANNIAPRYVNGALFANDGEFLLYGGLTRATDSSDPPAADVVLAYEANQYGPERTTWSKGFILSTLPDGVTRYISNGAAVSAPSENLGFYFSGIRGANWGLVDEITRDWYLANTLIEVDMSIMREEVWSNSTLPDDIPPRAGAELVWIPVGGQGALVAIGGMTAATDHLSSAGLNSTQQSEAEQRAPGFMTSLPVYDVVSRTWYMQNTTGQGPGPLTDFCSVVGEARDSSSFNVYIYGGYDGLSSETVPSDDVWILSIPSFTWFKAYSGVPAHGRRGHRCERIYPDQMLVIGGINLNPQHCLEGGPIQIFNLNTLRFQNVYDPREWAEYSVPDLITEVIGGNVQGGSNRTATFSDSALSSLFGTPYTKTTNRYYPYSPASGSPNATAIPSPVPSNGGLAKWVPPVLGVVLGLIALSIIAVIILVYRNRKSRRGNSGTSSSGRASYNNPILNWINGMPNQSSDRKTDDWGSSTEADNDATVSAPLAGFSEVAGQERYEIEAKERERPVAEMATPWTFQDHPNYPRNIDFAYGTGASDQSSRSQQNNVDVSQTRLQGLCLSPSTAISSQSPPSPRHTQSNSRGGSVPSPFVLPHRPEDVGSRSATNSPSPTLSAVRSPDLNLAQNRQDGSVDAGADSDATATGPAATTITTGGIGGRPAHHRNVSSLSTNVGQLSSPDLTLSPDEDLRRSQYLSGLSNSPPLRQDAIRFGAMDGARAGQQGLGEGELGREDEVGAGRVGVVEGREAEGGKGPESTQTAGKKSSFGEMLDDRGGNTASRE